MKHEITLSDEIVTWKTTFGECFDFKKVIPLGTNLVVLLTNDGTGYRTEGVSLPHQIYVDKLQKLVEEKGAKEFSIIPVDSKTIVKIASVEIKFDRKSPFRVTTDHLCSGQSLAEEIYRPEFPNPLEEFTIEQLKEELKRRGERMDNLYDLNIDDMTGSERDNFNLSNRKRIHDDDHIQLRKCLADGTCVIIDQGLALCKMGKGGGYCETDDCPKMPFTKGLGE
jgi:hypothetical protein